MNRKVFMAILAAVALGLGSCADDPASPAYAWADSVDAASQDGATADIASDSVAQDAVQAQDTGQSQDAVQGQDAAAATTKFLLPQTPRRGPIELRIEVSSKPLVAELAAATLEFDGGQGWKKATLLGGWQEQGSTLAVVWDSFADVSADGAVQLRINIGASQAAAALDVRNAPETPRLVLTAHPSMDLPGGGSAPRNTEVSALRWQGAKAEGQPTKLQVGKGPIELHAAPHGRATALIADFDGTFWLIHTPLDAAVAAVKAQGPFSLPHGQPSDLAWSADGRSLYVLGTNGSGPAQPAVLWRYQPAEDLSSLGDPAPLATFDRPAMALGVERNHPADRDEWAYVVLGPGPVAKLGQLAAVKATGGLAAPLLDTDVGVPNDLAVSPAGGLGLLTSDLFGNEIIRYSLGNPLVEVTRKEPAKVPYQVVFHPASTQGKHVALISNLDKNAVTPLVVTAEAMTEGPAVTGLPLAAEMDLIERGSQTGLVLVSALNQLIAVKLSEDGAATKLGLGCDFGSGTVNFSGAVAIQR